ncbi:MAG: anaerobic ribonucleoside-triphosphate reductase activating protein [Chloroflexi bacterium]|nr:anaerobic ribonucleoside-triphosphate reductase activating protein [Chloroflexota bacterium]
MEQWEKSRIQDEKEIQSSIMKIGGFQKVSLVDYPGKICAVVFLQGCNFRCPYCHNPELVQPERFSERIPSSIVINFLRKRQKLLDAVTISGGEPTIHPDIIDLITDIKALGYCIKLDTNGSNPDILEKLILNKWIDYIAMDIKAPINKYDFVVGQTVSIKLIQRSVHLVINSKVDYEFRTTIDWDLLNKADLLSIAIMVKGAKRLFLQKLNQNFSQRVITTDLEQKNAELPEIAEELSKYVQTCVIR